MGTAISIPINSPLDPPFNITKKIYTKNLKTISIHSDNDWLVRKIFEATNHYHYVLI